MGGTSANVCLNCFNDTFSAIPGATACTNCTAGRNARPGASQCLLRQQCSDVLKDVNKKGNDSDYGLKISWVESTSIASSGLPFSTIPSKGTNKFFFGDQVVLTCLDGSRPEGAAVLTCGDDGAWFPNPTSGPGGNNNPNGPTRCLLIFCRMMRIPTGVTATLLTTRANMTGATGATSVDTIEKAAAPNIYGLTCAKEATMYRHVQVGDDMASDTHTVVPRDTVELDCNQGIQKWVYPIPLPTFNLSMEEIRCRCPISMRIGEGEEATKCLWCPDHTYAPLNRRLERKECRACPRVGVDCTGGKLDVLPDYWYDVPSTIKVNSEGKMGIFTDTKLYKCSARTACLVNTTTVPQSMYCHENHTSVLCEKCFHRHTTCANGGDGTQSEEKCIAPAYFDRGSEWMYFAKIARHCERCPAGNAAIISYVLTAIAGLLVLVVGVILVIGHLDNTEKRVRELAEARSHGGEEQHNSTSPIARLMMNWLQATALLSTIKLTPPEAVQEASSYTEYAQGISTSSFFIKCTLRWDYYITFGFELLNPVLACVLPALVVLMSAPCKRVYSRMSTRVKARVSELKMMTAHEKDQLKYAREEKEIVRNARKMVKDSRKKRRRRRSSIAAEDMMRTIREKLRLEAESGWWTSRGIVAGMKVQHSKRGAGVVVAISPDNDGRVHVEFKGGDVHKYREPSWAKMETPDAPKASSSLLPAEMSSDFDSFNDSSAEERSVRSFEDSDGLSRTWSESDDLVSDGYDSTGAEAMPQSRPFDVRAGWWMNKRDYAVVLREHAAFDSRRVALSIDEGAVVRAEEVCGEFFRIAARWGTGWASTSDFNHVPAAQVVASQHYVLDQVEPVGRAASPLHFSDSDLDEDLEYDAVAHRFRALHAICPETGITRDVIELAMRIDVTEVEIDDRMREWDRDGDGVISLEEYRAADSAIVSEWRYGDAWLRFAAADLDRDGVLTNHEVLDFMPSTAADTDISEWMRGVDRFGAHGVLTLADVRFAAHTTQVEDSITVLAAAATMGVFIMYIRTAKAVMAMFSTESIEGVAYLKREIGTRAYTQTHIGMIALASVYGLVFVIGIPIAALYIIYLNKNSFASRTMQASFGFLFEGYREKLFWWEFAVLLRKVCILAAALFWEDPFLQSIVALFVLIISIIVHMACWPYEERFLNIAELFSLLSLFTLVALAVLLWYVQAPGRSQHVVLYEYAVTLVIFLFYAGLGCALVGRVVYLEARTRSKSILASCPCLGGCFAWLVRAEEYMYFNSTKKTDLNQKGMWTFLEDDSSEEAEGDEKKGEGVDMKEKAGDFTKRMLRRAYKNRLRGAAATDLFAPVDSRANASPVDPFAAAMAEGAMGGGMNNCSLDVFNPLAQINVFHLSGAEEGMDGGDGTSSSTASARRIKRAQSMRTQMGSGPMPPPARGKYEV